MEIILIIIACLVGVLGILLAGLISEVVDLKEEIRTLIVLSKKINKNNTTFYY